LDTVELPELEEKFKAFIRKYQKPWLFHILDVVFLVGILALSIDLFRFYSIGMTYIHEIPTKCTWIFVLAFLAYFLCSYYPDENTATQFLIDLSELDSNFDRKDQKQIMTDFDDLWKKAIYMKARLGDFVLMFALNMLGYFFVRKQLTRISLKIEKLYLNRKDQERYDRIINKLKERFDYSSFFRGFEILLIIFVGLFGFVWKFVPDFWGVIAPFIFLIFACVALINFSFMISLIFLLWIVEIILICRGGIKAFFRK